MKMIPKLFTYLILLSLWVSKSYIVKFSSRYQLSKHLDANIEFTGDNDVIPRLAPDKEELFRWIREKGGEMGNQRIQSNGKGWSLVTTKRLETREIVATIPKSICISNAITNDPYQHDSPLLESARTLMQSLNPKLWRARLAIAVLSERVRSNSPFKSYIRNLPHEIRGLPIFYSSYEFDMIQDYGLTAQTRDRCRFLNEFVEQALMPLSRAPPHVNPFSNQRVDLNAFGWAFAVAASRAFRAPLVVGNAGPTLIPGLDLLSHSFNPNCEIVNSGMNFFLVSTREVIEGEELTVSYGEMNNDELLGDYGFTVDANPHDEFKLRFDPGLVNTARVAMGLGTYSNDNYHLGRFGVGDNLSGSSTSSAIKSSGVTVIGRSSHAYDENWLHAWQQRWLSMLELGSYSNSSNAVSIKGSKLSDIDGKLWAILRVLYSHNEFDITKHGFDPFILQNAYSCISNEIEENVIKTLIGIAAVVLHNYESDLNGDLEALLNRDVDKIKKSTGMRDIVAEVQQYVRNAITRHRVSEATSLIPSISRIQKSILDSSTSKTLDTLASTSKTVNSLIDSQSNINAEDDGIQFDEKENYSWNIHELLKYRIRKKRVLVNLISTLIAHYYRVSPEGALLPTEDRRGRTSKIRDLMNEIATREVATDEYTSVATKLSSIWSSKNLAL